MFLDFICCVGCKSGFYGRDCENRCHCQRAVCDRFNGTCDCPAGWTGSDCSQSMLSFIIELCMTHDQFVLACDFIALKHVCLGKRAGRQLAGLCVCGWVSVGGCLVSLSL